MKANFINMKVASFSMFFVLLCTLASCKREEQSLTDQYKDLGSIYITLPNGEGYFNPVGSTPYDESIVFEFPTHFPLDSDDEFSLAGMRINTNSPSRVEVIGQKDNIVDMSKEFQIVIHKGNGESSKHTVKSIIKESSEAELLSFSLPTMNLEGYVRGQLISLIAGGADLSNLTPQVLVSKRATIHPLPTTPQNFNNPVEYTVTAQDGVTTKKYTVKFATPGKVSNGIRLGSARQIWTKTLTELGIDATNHMTTSIAVSKGDLIVNTREKRNKIINRFNGALIGEMVMGDIATETFQNFFITSDSKGQLLMSNLVAAAGNSLAIYKWKNSSDSNPKKLINWTMAAAWNVGRKMSVIGDLDKSAVIYLAASNSGNTVLRWKITNGVAESQIPEALTFPGATSWTQMADVAPTSTDLSAPIFITGHPGNISYWDQIAQRAAYVFPNTNLNLIHNNALDFVEFNQARYISFGRVEDKFGEFYLFNVTDPSHLEVETSNPLFKDYLVLRTSDLITNSNGNRTSDVVMKVSDDGYKLHMYCLLTNGVVVAYEFDCIDFDTL